MRRYLVLLLALFFMNNIPWLDYPIIEKDKIQIKKVHYHGWYNSIKLSNPHLEMIIVTDIGPRIISLRTKKGKNIFFNDKRKYGWYGGKRWYNYGGHRLWHAPEANPRTYQPDNRRVKWQKITNGIRLIQRVEHKTGIGKVIEIKLEPDEPVVSVKHRLVNHNAWEIDLAPWALSVLGKGAQAILPMPPRGKHMESIQPVGSLIFWAYTNLADKRFHPGREFIQIHQDFSREEPFKIGISHEKTWGAAIVANSLFIKATKNFPNKTYPNRGSRFEVFTSSKILEFESLGPLQSVAPGAEAVHTEHWHLVPWQGTIVNEQQIRKRILPHVHELQKRIR